MAWSATPVVTIKSPLDDDHLRGKYTIDFNYTDADNNVDQNGLVAGISYLGTDGRRGGGVEFGIDLDEECDDNDVKVSTANRCRIKWDTTEVVDGEYDLTVVVEDLAENEGRDSVTVVVDNVWPEVSIYPVNNSFVSAEFQLDFNVVDVNPVTCSLEVLDFNDVTIEEDLNSCNGSFEVNSDSCPSSGERSCRVVFTAVDQAGNTERSTYFYSKDLVKPSAPVMSAPLQLVVGSELTLSWTESTDNLSLAGYVLEYALSSDFGDANYIESDVNFLKFEALAEGKYYFRVKAVDAAGNYAYSNTVQSVLDQDAPRLKSSLPSDGNTTTSSKPLVSFELEENGSGVDSSTLSVSLDGAELDPSIVSVSGNSVSFNTPSELPEGVPHLVEVSVSDEAGNRASLMFSFQVISPPTGLGIRINDGAQSTTSRTVRLSLTASDAVECRYRNEDSVLGGSYEPFTLSKDWNLSYREGSKTVYYQCRDESGNESVEASASIAYDDPLVDLSDFEVRNSPTQVSSGQQFSLEVFSTKTSQPAGDSLVKIIYESGASQVVRADSSGKAFFIPTEEGGVKFEILEAKASSAGFLNLESAISSPEVALVAQALLGLSVLLVTFYLYSTGKKPPKPVEDKEGKKEKPKIEVHFSS